MTPRQPLLRYRLALRAWPAAIRREAGAEIVATLAEGDAARGHGSTREAVALVGAGLRMRLRYHGADAALVLGGLLVLAAAVAPADEWMGSEIVFPDGTRSSGGQPQAWWTREALIFVAPLAIGRLRAIAVPLVIAAPVLLWLTNGVLPQGGIGYGLSRDGFIEYGGVGLAAAVPAIVIVLATRRWTHPVKRRVAAAVVAACALAGLPGSIDRRALGEGGVAYANGWAHDIGWAVPLVIVGIALLLLALVAPTRTSPERHIAQ